MNTAPTLIDWSQVRSKVASYRERHEHDTDSLALGHAALEAIFGLDPEGRRP